MTRVHAFALAKLRCPVVVRYVEVPDSISRLPCGELAEHMIETAIEVIEFFMLLSRSASQAVIGPSILGWSYACRAREQKEPRWYDSFT